MKTVLLIHGPNLNLIGIREVKHYGILTLFGLVKFVKEEAKINKIKIISYQSNHEGELIDFIQENRDKSSGIIINPGALTHYSYALYDCLLDTNLPCVEVHLSKVNYRETWRKISVTAPACIAKISGKKEQGYIEALEMLIKKL